MSWITPGAACRTHCHLQDQESLLWKLRSPGAYVQATHLTPPISPSLPVVLTIRGAKIESARSAEPISRGKGDHKQKLPPPFFKNFQEKWDCSESLWTGVKGKHGLSPSPSVCITWTPTNTLLLSPSMHPTTSLALLAVLESPHSL